MILRDIFGREIDTDAPLKSKRKKPRREIPNGYFAKPGTGPAGETCKTCAFVARVQHSKVYLKCERMRDYWTGSYGTDIRLKSPACSGWLPHLTRK